MFTNRNLSGSSKLSGKENISTNIVLLDKVYNSVLGCLPSTHITFCSIHSPEMNNKIK